MAQDITLNGADFPGVPAVVLPTTDGGEATFWDMTGPLAHLGVDAEFIKQIHASETALADTTFATWTPSTTAKAIKATANSGTLVADMENEEIVIRWRFRADLVYTDGTTPKAAPETECSEMYQVCIRRPNSLASLAAETEPGNACVTYFTAPLLVYYNTSGTKTYTFATSYGIYPGLTAATFSSTTAAKPTITFKTPTFNARCNSTYFSTTMANAVDKEASTVKLIGEVYRIRKGGLAHGAYKALAETYAHGLTIE